MRGIGWAQARDCAPWHYFRGGVVVRPGTGGAKVKVEANLANARAVCNHNLHPGPDTKELRARSIGEPCRRCVAWLKRHRVAGHPETNADGGAS